MVSQKYRWDFIGLSTDTKPTPETSEKVVNGSTFYCSDTSKLYVFCDGTWYERKALGGGGGGGGYAGKNLGDEYTIDELSAKVQSGDFSGIHIGDYITKTVKVGANTEREEDFVVAGIDYWRGVGDTELTTHHL